MTCPQCGAGMTINGSMWQCQTCGYLQPRVAPEPTTALLPLTTTER